MYRILSSEVKGETLNTEVEFTLSDGTIIVSTVAHFMPESAEVVTQNIENREASEQIKHDASKRNLQIKQELDAEA